ncbi:aminoacyl-tRNA hydrolase [Kitasatospora sp. NPDC058965]|uniref:aminoacyl-tRNA hydrolase n=1 Tax=Kitasatospora sp. NPDC058965 TaxID=3346682 RepID=UPI003687BE71
MTSAAPFDAPSEPQSATANERDQRPQYVLPLVLHLEKAEPPARTDALETSARAVLTLLADPRATGEGEWAEAVHQWEDARIRKVLRRARGGEWRKAAELPGITVTGAAAEVRVYPPIPLDGWPKELAKLQVSGTDLDDPVPPAPVTDPALPVLWLNPELEMSAGKTMAQTGHAAQLAWWELDETQRKEWAAGGFALAVRTADPARWAALTDGRLPLVRDAGFTEIAPGSCTVVADHPALR